MRKTTVLAALLVLAGCGGGGGSSAGAPPTGSGAQPKLAQATLTISFPVGGSTSSAGRKPQYVSPNSNSIKITINSLNGDTTLPSYVTPNPYVATLTTTGGSPNCTVSGGTETCTITNVPAPPGTVNYTFGVYASTDGSGTALATATVDESVSSGVLNTFTVTLSGVATTLVTSIGTTAFTANTPLTQNDIVAVDDPSGARIVGTAPFNGGATVTVTDNDTSGQTSLQAGTGGGSATICGSATVCTLSHGADTVNLVYTGRAASGTGAPPVDSFTLTAASSGLTTATANLSITDNSMTIDLTTLDDTGHGGQSGDPNYNQPTLFFAGTGGSAAVTAAELGWSNSPYNQTFTSSFDSTTCGTGASAVATVGSSTGTTFTYTAQKNGICKVTISDGVGQSKVFWISVTVADVTVNGEHRHP